MRRAGPGALPLRRTEYTDANQACGVTFGAVNVTSKRGIAMDTLTVADIPASRIEDIRNGIPDLYEGTLDIVGRRTPASSTTTWMEHATGVRRTNRIRRFTSVDRPCAASLQTNSETDAQHGTGRSLGTEPC